MQYPSRFPGVLDTFLAHGSRDGIGLDIDWQKSDEPGSNEFDLITDAILQIERSLGGGIGVGAGLWDTDRDTGIQVEEAADEDIIRFDTAGTERMTISATGVVDVADLAGGGSRYIYADNVGDLIAGIVDPIAGDGTAGRILRRVYINIVDGTNVNTLKCNVGSRWNGDTIGVTDNIIKNATTGDFTLNAAGTLLTIEATGLTGNVLMAIGSMSYNVSTSSLFIGCRNSLNDIVVEFMLNADGVAQDITALVDAAGATGQMIIEILYVTNA